MNWKATRSIKKMRDTRSLLHREYDKLLKEDEIITAHLIKTGFLGTDQEHHSLNDLLNYHNTAGRIHC